jgi:predicted Zn-dependent peptidase
LDETSRGEYTTLETLNNVTLDDVKANYAAYFAPENAYLVIIGDIKYKEVKPVVENFSAPGNEQIQLKCPTQLQRTFFYTNYFIDVPNANPKYHWSIR